MSTIRSQKNCRHPKPETPLCSTFHGRGAIVFHYNIITIVHKTQACNMIDATVIPQEQPTMKKQLSSSKRSLPRVMKSLQRGAADDDECDRSTGTRSSSSSLFAVPLKSCMKQTRTQTTPNKKKVTFDSLEIHEHAVILDVNSSVSSGPLLTMSWEAQASLYVSLDEYEASRPARRQNEEMYVAHEIREDWLLRAGYDRSDFDFAEIDMSIQKTEKERAASAKGNLMNVMVRKLTKCRSAKAFSNILPRMLSGR
jgi:hypothetical protein